MSFRKSFSGFRKKAKDKLSKIGGGTGEIRANAGDDGLHRPASSTQSEPAIVAQDEFKGDPKAGGGRGDPRPDGSPLVSRSAVEIGPTQGGSDDEPGGGETHREGLHPHSYLRAGGRSSREERVVGGEQAGRADLPQSDIEKGATPVPPTFRAGEPESM